MEDLYRPFKEKKKTKATEAIKLGLEPLAKEIFRENKDIEEIAKKYINDKVKDATFALEQACFIVAENISDDAKFRKYIRDNTMKFGVLKSVKKKKAEDEAHVYEMYYDYHERVNRIVSHRILAINRAENEKVIAVNIVVDKDFLTQYINRGVTKNRNSSVNEHLFKAVEDSLNRLLLPSIEREVRSELTEKASEQALKVFSINLEKLLMQAPLKDKMVLVIV